MFLHLSVSYSVHKRGGSLSDRDPPGQRPLDIDPLDRDPLDRDPLDRDPGQKPPWTENPPPCTENPPTATPMVKRGRYTSYGNAFLLVIFFGKSTLHRRKWTHWGGSTALPISRLLHCIFLLSPDKLFKKLFLL